MSSHAKNRAIQGVEAIFERYHMIARAKNFSGFDKALMSSLKIVDATPEGTATFSLLIDEKYTNLNGVMHGGAAGVIFDMATTTALGPLAKPGYWDFMGGVTRSLNISYLRAVPINTTVHLHSTVMQVGRTMALIRGIMTSPDGKVTYCTCEHHKVNVPSLPEHMAFRVDWDRLWDNEKAAKL